MNILRNLTLLFAIVALCGCIKVDQTLSINDDGSGILDLKYSMRESTIKQMEGMTSQMDSSQSEDRQEEKKPFDFEPAEVRKELERFEDQGIKVENVDSSTADGWKTMHVELAFDDLASLSKTDFFKDKDVSLKKNAKGNYVFSQKAKDSAGMSAGGEDASPEQLQQMAPMFSGMRIVHRIKVPSEIIESNANEIKGKTASWVFDVDKDPTVLTKIKNLDMQVEFDGEGVDLSDASF